MGFLSPDPGPAPTLPPPPTPNDPDTARRREEAAAQERKIKGRASNIVAGENPGSLSSINLFPAGNGYKKEVEPPKPPPIIAKTVGGLSKRMLAGY